MLFHLKQHSPPDTKWELIYTEFEHFYQNLLKNVQTLPEGELYQIKAKVRNILADQGSIQTPRYD